MDAHLSRRLSGRGALKEQCAVTIPRTGLPPSPGPSIIPAEHTPGGLRRAVVFTMLSVAIDDAPDAQRSRVGGLPFLEARRRAPVSRFARHEFCVGRIRYQIAPEAKPSAGANEGRLDFASFL